MNRNIRNLVIAIFPSIILPVITQLPFSYYVLPAPGVYSCPANGCHFLSWLSPLIFLADYFSWLMVTFGIVSIIDRAYSAVRRNVEAKLQNPKSLKKEVRTFIMVQAIIILLVFGVSIPSILQYGAIGPSSSSISYYSTTNSTTLTSSTNNLPSSSTKASTFACTNNHELETANESILSFAVSGIDVNLTIQPAVSILPTGCSYSMIHNTTPTACGVMCGGGVGYIEYYSDRLQTNFSIGNITSVNSAGGYNATVSADRLTSLFQNLATQVYVNAQQIDWNGYPPSCLEGDSSGTSTYSLDCLTSSTTHLTFALPGTTTTYSILVNSSKTLVP